MSTDTLFKIYMTEKAGNISLIITLVVSIAVVIKQWTGVCMSVCPSVCHSHVVLRLWVLVLRHFKDKRSGLGLDEKALTSSRS